MSRIYDFRESIKTAIVEANLGLEADDIVVARQADIMTEISTITAKVGNGVACVIGAAKGRNKDPLSTDIDEQVTLTVELWVRPIYSPDTKPEEDIFEPLKSFLHGLELVGVSQVYQELRYESWQDRPDPEYLVREITLTQRMLF